MQDMQYFVDDDQGYLGWIATHPAGYVLEYHQEPIRGIPDAASRQLLDDQPVAA